MSTANTAPSIDRAIEDKGYAHPEVLVSTEWLAEHLDDPSIRILESDEDVLLYHTGHIPGAQKIDWHEDLNDPLRRDYITKERFEEPDVAIRNVQHLYADAEAQARLAATLGSIGDAVLATDPESRVTYVNPVAEQLLGYSAQEVVGRPLEEVFNLQVARSVQVVLIGVIGEDSCLVLDRVNDLF